MSAAEWVVLVRAGETPEQALARLAAPLVDELKGLGLSDDEAACVLLQVAGFWRERAN